MIRRLQITLLALFVSVWAMASDTSVKNADGVEIWYDFDSSTKTASVTYKGKILVSFNDEYTGEVVIPSKVTYEREEYSVTEIGDYAFYGCDSLTSIKLPESLTKIGEGAFSYCSSLTSIDVALDNNNYISIDGVLFSKDKTILLKYPEGKKDATPYIIPESVTEIGEYAFEDCSSLTSITIPESVKTIGEGAFNDCSSLTSIDVALDNNSYTSIDGVLFSKDKTTLIQFPGGKKDVTSYALPESVTEIREYAFFGCSSLTSITLPEGLTKIGEGAFFSCSSLTSITLPEGLTKIGEGAFFRCSSLTSIMIPEGVTEIGKSAFRDCSSLTSITSMNVTPPSIGDSYTLDDSYTFYGVNKSIPVYVPKQSVKAYKSAEYWKDFTNIQGLEAYKSTEYRKDSTNIQGIDDNHLSLTLLLIVSLSVLLAIFLLLKVRRTKRRSESR